MSGNQHPADKGVNRYTIPDGPAGPAPADTATHHATLNCYDGDGQLICPPDEVLQVCVVGPHAFLSLCKYEETATASRSTQVSEAHVDAWALLRALADQLGVSHLIVGASR